MSCGEFWIVNSIPSAKAFYARIEADLHEHHYTSYRWRHGADRSPAQGELFHVWCRQWIAYKLKKPPSQVSDNELEGMKRTVKKIYYQHTCAPWMVQRLKDYSEPDGRETTTFTSSRTWSKGEMCDVLDLMQICAGHDGLILEALGEHAALKRKQNGVTQR